MAPGIFESPPGLPTGTSSSAESPARLRRLLRPLVLTTVVAVVAVAAALAVRPTTTIGPEDGLLWHWVLADGFSLQSRYAWTSAEATLRIPGAGPGAWDLGVELSGWRPRGHAGPRVEVHSGSTSRTLAASRRKVEIDLPARSGFWRSVVGVTIRSDTFVPGGPDRRVLGARVYRLRLRPIGGRWGVPPLGPLLLAALAIGLVVVALVPSLGTRVPTVLGALLALAAGVACLLYRPWMLAFLPRLALGAGVFALSVFCCRRAAELVGASLLMGARTVWFSALDIAWPGLPILVVIAAVGTLIAHTSQPIVVVDPATKAGLTVARGLGPPDRVNGRHARGLGPRSRFLLDDLGGGGHWRISVVAASDANVRQVVLARIRGQRLRVDLGHHWATHHFDVAIPLGWAAGATIELAQPLQRQVMVSQARVDRRGTWPSPRIVVWLVLAGACLATALRIAKVRRALSLAAGALLILSLVAVLGWNPLLGLASIPTAMALCLMAVVPTAVVGGALERLERDGRAVDVWRAALPGAVLGFVAWTLVMTFPLYKGGHFVFHSSIAEEIWHGRFMTYYLPYPGSMLSEQAQWGSVKMPHPCLYQTLIAPLAAFPRTMFYFAEKVSIGLLLASVALVAGVVAGRVGSMRAATFAGLLVAASAPAFQLLELGHLMALLGVWASTLAMAYLTLCGDRLSRPRERWIFIALLTLALLAYFASVPFLGLSLALLLPFLWRHDRGAARWVVFCVLVAGLLAFGLYYVNWSWPFLSESVPRLLGIGPRHVGSAPSELRKVALVRLMREPDKLTYTFGSWIVPLVGVAGLFLARGLRSKAVLLAWVAMLPIVCVLDVQFNFLLKHHYYTIAPVSIGLALLLTRLDAARGYLRWLAWPLLLAAGGLGLRAALAAATGFGA